MIDFDLEKLMQNDFFVKKRQRELAARDTNKDGFISRADFDMIIQRHIDMGTSAEKVKQLREMVDAMCDSIGLTDHGVKYTYDEYYKQWEKRTEKMGVSAPQFEGYFNAVDLNNDGEISLEEWIIHNKCFGIDPAHAKASFNAMSQGDGRVSQKQFVDYHLEFYYTAEDNLKSSILFGPLDWNETSSTFPPSRAKLVSKHYSCNHVLLQCLDEYNKMWLHGDTGCMLTNR